MARPSSLTLFLILCLALTALAPAQAEAPPLPSGTLRFLVSKAGEPVGHHTIRFRRQGQMLRVVSSTRIEVRAAFVTLYRFRQQSTETWRGRELLSISAVTSRDGKLSVVNRRFAHDRVQSTSGRDVAPGSLWAEWQLTRRLLVDTVDGSVSDLAPLPLDGERLRLDGRELAARRYALTGDKRWDLWFGPDRLLLKMRIRAADGSVFEITRSPERSDAALAQVRE